MTDEKIDELGPVDGTEVLRHRKLTTSARAARRGRLRLIAVGVAGTLVILTVGGCGVSSSSTPTNSSYWLIRVQDGYGNIYGYGTRERPGPGIDAQYLGPTTTDAYANAPAAAKRLGIKHVDSGTY